MDNRNYSLRIGELVGKSMGIFGRNLVPFSLLSAIVMSPWIALLLFAQTRQPDPGLAIGIALLQTVLAWVLTGAVTYGVVQQMQGENPGIGDQLAAGFRSIGRVLLTSLVTGVLIGLGTMLLIVPGIILTVVFYVAVPAAVVEKLAVGRAMSRSGTLTKGSRWQIFAAAVLIGAIMIGVALLGAFAFAATAEEDAPAWFQITIAILLTPLQAIMCSVCYALLRHGKENVDAKQLAAVFD